MDVEQGREPRQEPRAEQQLHPIAPHPRLPDHVRQHHERQSRRRRQRGGHRWHGAPKEEGARHAEQEPRPDVADEPPPVGPEPGNRERDGREPVTAERGQVAAPVVRQATATYRMEHVAMRLRGIGGEQQHQVGNDPGRRERQRVDPAATPRRGSSEERERNQRQGQCVRAREPGARERQRGRRTLHRPPPGMAAPLPIRQPGLVAVPDGTAVDVVVTGWAHAFPRD